MCIYLSYVAVTTVSSTAYSSPASSIMGALPTQQQQQHQPSANSSSSTGHLFGHQSQGTAPFLPQQQQQQVASIPGDNVSLYSPYQ